ncbi:peptidoglycan editing factor PgeF [Bacteroides sp. 224]|uniref:peptidoglycan editing factor PgeF n=1 Tax=Bacteroides sp. 224 TaxID=2302936 RepID=UPI0013D5DBCA|nr:peptidoglycan editing factor PgeF [Bacteroides sp. 224]NDV65432.1 peptidoglycan editing factor PgeF [Bacteroides sp. 224]
MISLTTDKRMLGYEMLSMYPNISHFVTTRNGGSGTGNYTSFNCSPYCGDEAEVVKHNQELLRQGLSQPDAQLIIPRQTHGADIGVIDEVFLNSSEEEQRKLLDSKDAVVTNQKGCCVCVSTADCVPLLLYDQKQQVVAAVHAGWRSTVSCIVAKTLKLMQEVYKTKGEDVVVTIGPSISLISFEVGEEVYKAFDVVGFDMNRISYRDQDSGKPHINLQEANRMQLIDFGIPQSQIELANICTYINHEDFFSARRLGIDSGRMLSGIMIRTK